MFHEIEMFGRAMAAGALIGVCYDFFRACRRKIRHSIVAVYVEDFLFWVFTAMVLFVLFQKYNHGVLRFYVILGLLTGGALYGTSVGRLCFPILCLCFQLFSMFVDFLTRILGKCRKILRKILIFPLKNFWERIRIVHKYK